ncbi:hypothetical protein CesoFtcFv8_001724 [Champsocephalus esox]|uniref:Uncharacterized protein n=1 Tax=Champsocephalus esox TaxID=159716 RepID=A0AAN8D2I4_9TELE|nr:hypothetical protein CesoFtcFv8_001724 [Champsocephalus esox]
MRLGYVHFSPMPSPSSLQTDRAAQCSSPHRSALLLLQLGPSPPQPVWSSVLRRTGKGLCCKRTSEGEDPGLICLCSPTSPPPPSVCLSVPFPPAPP